MSAKKTGGRAFGKDNQVGQPAELRRINTEFDQ